MSHAPAGPLVVFDFDHTLYRGDSGAHMFEWMIRRSRWRVLAAWLASPVLGLLILLLPTRRIGISGFVWIATVGLGRGDFDARIAHYVERNAEVLRKRLLPLALERLHAHREAGDSVVIATGAPPGLARRILAFVAHENVPVVGTLVGRHLGAVTASRHCHAEGKLVMLREAGFTQPIARCYTDSTADLPLLRASAHPVVVNPKPKAIETFRRELGADVEILDWQGR